MKQVGLGYGMLQYPGKVSFQRPGMESNASKKCMNAWAGEFIYT
ncbi:MULTISPECIES: hypothetical protein [Chitinophaga]|nr:MULTISPECIES: hypothetical protein [Chitinophaga]